MDSTVNRPMLRFLFNITIVRHLALVAMAISSVPCGAEPD